MRARLAGAALRSGVTEEHGYRGGRAGVKGGGGGELHVEVGLDRIASMFNFFGILGFSVLPRVKLSFQHVATLWELDLPVELREGSRIFMVGGGRGAKEYVRARTSPERARAALRPAWPGFRVRLGSSWGFWCSISCGILSLIIMHSDTKRNKKSRLDLKGRLLRPPLDPPLELMLNIEWWG